MNLEYIKDYKSMKYPVGSIHATNDHGPLEILGRMDDLKCDLYAVKFLSTGFITKARTSGIKKGMVKDYYMPSVFCRGFMGKGFYTSKTQGKTTREYRLWTGMFYRCYSNDPQYKNYKDRGVEVSEGWLNFQVFCKEIQDLEGYRAWKEGYGMALDKDINYNGTYSPSSCKFITTSENSYESAIRNNLSEKGISTRFTPNKK